MAQIDEMHDCPMHVFLDIGPVEVGQYCEEEADTKIKICLCQRTWGSPAKVQGLTCQEFLNYCRKLYNYALEKKRAEVQARDQSTQV